LSGGGRPLFMFELLGRVVEILVFFAMLRSALSLILRIFRGIRTPGSRPPVSAPQNQGPAQAASETTLLHQDPVCGTYVAAGTSYRKICKGQVYHFCSEACRDKFAA
jgi:YHS domain-containing protein